MKNLLLMTLRKSSQDRGFTLLELLVSVVIISILAAIALPSFLNATNQARQAEGISNVGVLNRAQQAYYLENNGFAPSLDDLAAGIPAETNNYEFSSTGTNAGVNSNAVSQASLLDGSALAGFVGVVQLSASSDGAVNSLSIICVSEPGVDAVAPAAGTDLNSPGACGANQERR